jgi:methionine-rich copper-binding protein CopC
MTSRIVGGRVRAALLVATILTLAFPHLVAAHAELVRANPADGETVTRPVTAVTGRYSEDLTGGSRLVIKDGSGATVGTGRVDPENDRRMIARLAPALTEGDFTVESTSISAEDGDIERLTWTFTVAVAATASPSDSPSDGPGLSPSPSAAASLSPSPAPSANPSPTASPAPGDATSGTGDVLLPIIAALAIVAIGAGFLLQRSRTPRP